MIYIVKIIIKFGSLYFAKKELLIK